MRDVSRCLKKCFWLAFGCEGSGGRRHVGRKKKTTSDLPLDTREMVVVRDVSRGGGRHVGRRKKKPPLTHVWM